ncbi:MAG TPA: hypothetical protein VMF08_17995, partial [Candidatus Sulfotelmatobacter sp.]|nr:hypothetical protein [Candidatus Sulfotelmatobacter sp.]
MKLRNNIVKVFKHRSGFASGPLQRSCRAEAGRRRVNASTSKMRLPEWKRNKFVDFIGLKAIFGLVSITSLNVNLLTPTQMSDFAR